VLERIKDNIKIHEKEKKERIKRENKKAVDAKEANLKSEAVWN
jgi:sRNA-binding carbon storage regulator CsrA